MRMIVGRRQHELERTALVERLRAFRRLVIDVGTGGGRAVLATAAAEPDALVVGLDADAASMADASRRAAASPTRGGRPNALFVVGAAEDLPGPFEGLADEVVVRFPWGSLLRGVLTGEGPVAAGLAGAVGAGGSLILLTALQPKDGYDDLLPLVDDPASLTAQLRATYGPLALRVEECRTATLEEIATARSSWARRLRVGRDRNAVIALLRRS